MANLECRAGEFGKDPWQTGEFKQNGGTNYVEIEVISPELGPMILSMQRKLGKTPGQMHGEAQARITEQTERAKEIIAHHDLWKDDVATARLALQFLRELAALRPSEQAGT